MRSLNTKLIYEEPILHLPVINKRAMKIQNSPVKVGEDSLV